MPRGYGKSMLMDALKRFLQLEINPVTLERELDDSKRPNY